MQGVRLCAQVHTVGVNPRRTLRPRALLPPPGKAPPCSAGTCSVTPTTRSPLAVPGVCVAQTVLSRCFSCPSGICQCGHHTEGPSCERCLPGFYGNPFAGRADDCQPCPCPGQSSCTTVPESREVVCTHCPPGQRGEWLVPRVLPLPGVLGVEWDR